MSLPAQATVQACSRGSGNRGNREFYSFLDCRLRRNDTFWTAACAAVRPLTRRPLPRGEKQTGFLLAQE